MHLLVEQTVQADNNAEMRILRLLQHLNTTGLSKPQTDDIAS